MSNSHIGEVNETLLLANGGSRPGFQPLMGRLYPFAIQSANMRQILISVGLSIS
jgi:hypothetical protein